jgi:hypothetical protein
VHAFAEDIWTADNLAHMTMDGAKTKSPRTRNWSEVSGFPDELIENRTRHAPRSI